MDILKEVISSYGIPMSSLWIEVIQSSEWYNSPTQNRASFLDVIKAGQAAGIKLGIQSSKQDWETLFGSDFTDPSFNSIPLTYPGADDNMDFKDFQAFGPWKEPHKKILKSVFHDCNLSSQIMWH
jgi:hypothetical protein